jgi:ATP-dependent DNA helicase RecG
VILKGKDYPCNGLGGITVEAEEIKKLAEQGENDSVEFKEYVPGKWQDLKSKIPIAICALANTNGGALIIGVSKDGKIAGVPESPMLFDEKLKDLLHTGLNVPVSARLDKAEIDGKWIHWLEVMKYRGPEPLTYQKKIYVRRGASSVEPSPHERQELFNILGFLLTEDQIIPNTSVADINPVKFKDYLSRFGIDVITSPQPSFEQDLINREVVTEQFGKTHCTVYGLLCFGLFPQNHLPFAVIDLSIYDGLTRGDDIIFNRTCAGTISDQIEGAVTAFRELYRFEDFSELIRKDNFLLPLGAIREIVANAVIHRDYGITGSKILLDIFRDRVEITSPGELPNSLTPAKVLSGGVIRSRNEKIANFLLAMGAIESRGRGIPRVRKLMREFNGTDLELENDRAVRFVRAKLRIQK